MTSQPPPPPVDPHPYHPDYVWVEEHERNDGAIVRAHWRHVPRRPERTDEAG